MLDTALAKCVCVNLYGVNCETKVASRAYSLLKYVVLNDSAIVVVP